MIGRDVIADTLWPTSRGEACKNLRQVLWQLHSTLDTASEPPLIVSDAGFVGIDPGARMSADVGQLEAAHARLGRESGPELSEELAAFVKDVVARCTGELLEGCYEDWCLAERERYRAIHLNALDRLISHAEASGDLGAGIEYGRTLLRYDRAAERTHRRLMILRTTPATARAPCASFRPANGRCSKSSTSDRVPRRSPCTNSFARARRFRPKSPDPMAPVLFRRPMC